MLAAQVRVAELEGEEVKAQNRVMDARDALALVLNLPFENELILTDVLKVKSLPVAVDDLVEKALGSRPDLRVARLQVNAATSAIGNARAGLLPHIQGFAELALDSNEGFARQGESWTVGAMATWRLFAGGKSIGALREAHATKDAAQLQADYLASSVVREVRSTFRELTVARTQVDIAQKALKLSEERLRITGLQFREGLATSTDVLDAESQLRKSRMVRVQSLFDLNVGLEKMFFVVGNAEY